MSIPEHACVWECDQNRAYTHMPNAKPIVPNYAFHAGKKKKQPETNRKNKKTTGNQKEQPEKQKTNLKTKETTGNKKNND